MTMRTGRVVGSRRLSARAQGSEGWDFEIGEDAAAGEATRARVPAHLASRRARETRRPLKRGGGGAQCAGQERGQGA